MAKRNSKRPSFFTIVLTSALLFLTVYLVQRAIVARKSSAQTSSPTVTVDFSNTVGTWPHYERINNQIIKLQLGSSDQTLVKGLGTNLVRIIIKAYHYSTAENSYSFSYYYPALDEITGYGGTLYLSFEGVPTWLAAEKNADGTPNTYGPPKDYDKFEKMMTDAIRHYKTRYGNKFEYVEVWNEPNDGSKRKPVKEKYVLIYERMLKAVNAVNSSNPPTRLKIGGPATTKFTESGSTTPIPYITYFLDYVKNNNLRLDFLAWHDYWQKSQPKVLGDNVKTARNLLSSRGLSNTKIAISEWNVNGATLDKQGSAMVAAYAAAGTYYLLDQNTEIPMFWVIRHTNSTRKYLNQLHESQSNKVYPFYNVLKMMSMLKNTRIAVNSNGSSSAGLGVNAIATKDSSATAILLWNYQGAAYMNTTLQVNNLPSNYSQSNIRYEKYAVGENYSNWYANSSQDKLQKIEDKTLPPSNSLSETLSVKRNDVYLIVLTPGSSGPVSTPTPTARTTATPGVNTPTPTQPPPQTGTNLLLNNGFENGTTNWYFHTDASGNFTTTDINVSSGSKAASIEIFSQGSNVQLYQKDITLSAGSKYRLTFSARSNTGHDLNAAIIKHVSPFTVYGMSGFRADLTSSWKSFSVEFYASGFTGTVSDARLRFMLGSYDAAGDKYFMDDIRLEKI